MRRAPKLFPKHLPQHICLFMNGYSTIRAPKRKPSRSMFVEKTMTVAQGAIPLVVGIVKPLRLTVVVINSQKNDTSILVRMVSTTFPWSDPSLTLDPWIPFEVTLPYITVIMTSVILTKRTIGLFPGVFTQPTIAFSMSERFILRGKVIERLVTDADVERRTPEVPNTIFLSTMSLTPCTLVRERLVTNECFRLLTSFTAKVTRSENTSTLTIQL